MTINGYVQISLYLLVLLLLVKPLGAYMARVYSGEATWLDPLVGPVERLCYRLLGVRFTVNKKTTLVLVEEEMNWQRYAVAMLLFSAVSLLWLYGLQRIQALLPLNPAALGAITPHSAFNTAVSFVSNTNWQNYGGETTMSYLTQMVGLTVQNFVSAAVGMALLAALIRGIVRQQAQTVGNFWVDLTRSTLYILLPLSLLLALLLVTQGVVQTMQPYQSVPLRQATVDSTGQVITEQVLALGPTASQIAIKQLGTNGGGFFNVNSAHPFENPTPLSNFLEMLAILLIPAALCYTFGQMVGDTRQGWALLAAMTLVLLLFTVGAYAAEAAGNPRLTALGVDQRTTSVNPGGNMEGKEVRFGLPNSVLWAIATTAAANGSVNAMHDSFTPLGGLAPLLLIQLGEVIFGGVGSGLYGMIVFVIIAVFVAGLMVGRTPEYLGKKIEVYEMKMAALVILLMPLLVLGFTALAVMVEAGKSSITNPGAHGFSQILYAFSSMGNNNGSAFAGLGANTPFYNLLGGLAMLIARFWIAIPILAIGGSLARKKKAPVSVGALPTHTPLFVGWLIAIVLLVGALNFLPALALGPIVEQLTL